MTTIYATPQQLNRQQLIDELRAVLGREKLLSVEWRHDTIIILHTELNVDNISRLRQIVNDHDGQAANEKERQENAILIERRLQKEQVIKQIKKKRTNGEMLEEHEQLAMFDWILGIP